MFVFFLHIKLFGFCSPFEDLLNISYYFGKFAFQLCTRRSNRWIWGCCLYNSGIKILTICRFKWDFMNLCAICIGSTGLLHLNRLLDSEDYWILILIMMHPCPCINKYNDIVNCDEIQINENNRTLGEWLYYMHLARFGSYFGL